MTPAWTASITHQPAAPRRAPKTSDGRSKCTRYGPDPAACPVRRPADARALLRSALPGPFDERVLHPELPPHLPCTCPAIGCRRIAGQDADYLYSSEADPDGEFDHADTADAEHDFAAYRREIKLARQAAAGRDLDATFFHSHRNAQMSVR